MTLLVQTLAAMEAEFSAAPDIRADNPRERIGGNNPPAPTILEKGKAAFERHQVIIDNLYLEAKNWLDKKVETASEAAAVAQLVNLLRKAKKTADDERAEIVKPLDTDKKTIQELFNTLIGDTKTTGKGKAILALEAADAALAPYLAEQRRIQEEEARRAREEADRIRREAEEAARAANQYDLQAKEDAEALIQAANRADKDAKAAERARPQATGGGRAIGLRKVYSVEVIDYTAFARHVWANHPADMKASLDGIAKQLLNRDRHATSSVPGLKVEEKDAI